MDHTSTIFGSDKAALYYTEGVFRILVWQGVGQKLLVTDAGEVFALAGGDHKIRDGFIPALVGA